MGKRPNDVTHTHTQQTFRSAVRSPLATTTFDIPIPIHRWFYYTWLLTNAQRRTSSTINFQTFFPFSFIFPFFFFPPFASFSFCLVESHLAHGQKSRAHRVRVQYMSFALDWTARANAPADGRLFFCFFFVYCYCGPSSCFFFFFRPYIICLFARLFCSVILVWLFSPISRGYDTMYITIDRMMADGREPCRISKDIPARDFHFHLFWLFFFISRDSFAFFRSRPNEFDALATSGCSRLRSSLNMTSLQSIWESGKKTEGNETKDKSEHKKKRFSSLPITCINNWAQCDQDTPSAVTRKST